VVINASFHGAVFAKVPSRRNHAEYSAIALVEQSSRRSFGSNIPDAALIACPPWSGPSAHHIIEHSHYGKYIIAGTTRDRRRGRMNGGHIGRSLRRLEDRRFLTGRGRYVDDIDVPGQLHGIVLRSPYGHALIEGIDAAAHGDARCAWPLHRRRPRRGRYRPIALHRPGGDLRADDRAATPGLGA
jgi:hypothetical protein